MDFELSPTEKAFRDEVRAWLKANAPRDGNGEGDGDMKSFIESRRKWQKKMYEAGYVGMTWPASPRTCDFGTFTSLKKISLNSASPVIWTSGRTSMPGLSMSTSR